MGNLEVGESGVTEGLLDKEIGEKYFKTVAILTYLVERGQKYRNQVGKTFIQKLMYLIGKELNRDFGYRFHFYGPYSSLVEGGLNYASFLKSVDIHWDVNHGYFIKPSKNTSVFTKILSEEEKDKIESVLKEYGKLTVQDLSIVATAYYLKERYELSGEDLIQAVGNMKSYDKKRIKELLETHGILE
jgi:uncharacterized protein YwgA